MILLNPSKLTVVGYVTIDHNALLYRLFQFVINNHTLSILDRK